MNLHKSPMDLGKAVEGPPFVSQSFSTRIVPSAHGIEISPSLPSPQGLDLSSPAPVFAPAKSILGGILASLTYGFFVYLYAVHVCCRAEEKYNLYMILFDIIAY